MKKNVMNKKDEKEKDNEKNNVLQLKNNDKKN